jgi:hypothetical protein
VSEALRRLDGVTSISEAPDPIAWTCELTTRDGRLPSLPALARAVAGVGSPFSLRGVEATVTGVVTSSPAGPILRASSTGETFLLAPLTAKVQWDSRVKKDQPMTPAEQTAYDRIARAVEPGPRSMRVVARVVGAPGSTGSPAPLGEWVLEVRDFESFADASR